MINDVRVTPRPAPKAPPLVTWRQYARGLVRWLVAGEIIAAIAGLMHTQLEPLWSLPGLPIWLNDQLGVALLGLTMPVFIAMDKRSFAPWPEMLAIIAWLVTILGSWFCGMGLTVVGTLVLAGLSFLIIKATFAFLDWTVSGVAGDDD